MQRQREALLVAVLAGFVILGAAAFVVQPSVGQSGQRAIYLGSTPPVATDFSRLG